MTGTRNICFLICLALLPLALAAQPVESPQGRMPNFVILFADDLGFEAYFSPRSEYWDVPLMQSESMGQEYLDRVLERPVNQETLTRRSTQMAQEFIDRHADRPFFLYVPYAMPHTPLFAGPEFAGTSLAGRYGDVIEEIDWSAGEIRRSLERAGVAEDTLVVFTSDNGPWLTMRADKGTAGPLRNGKGTTFEGGIRVPGVMWWPGSIQPGVVRDIGSAMDLFPTLLALAGGTTEDVLDGVDLSGTLLRGEPGTREVLAHYRAGELYALRKGPYKIHLITENAYGIGPERTEHETPLLYHLGEDPGESWDLAAERPEILAEMLEAMREHQAAMEMRPSLFESR